MGTLDDFMGCGLPLGLTFHLNALGNLGFDCDVCIPGGPSGRVFSFPSFLQDGLELCLFVLVFGLQVTFIQPFDNFLIALPSNTTYCLLPCACFLLLVPRLAWPLGDVDSEQAMGFV